MKNDLKDIGGSIQSVNSQTESKLKEEANQIYRNVDFKLEKNKKEIQNILAEFKNTLALSLKRQEEGPGQQTTR